MYRTSSTSRHTPKLSSQVIGSSSLPPNSLFKYFGGDANQREDDRGCGSIMLEIDKGIRSTNPGDQVEAIVFSGHLMMTYPTPMVINTTMFKLADLFRLTNSNLVRYRVLKAVQQCARVLSKRLHGADEIIKRIHSVIQSNDPIARALSLRMLGSVPDLISERLNVHHSVRVCLSTSHDMVEIDATIFAMDALCACSHLFASSVVDLINDAIQRLETPPDVKLKYIALFRHMHHGAEEADAARSILLRLLVLYPSLIFTNVILTTLTQLAAKHILFIPDQVVLLTTTAQSDLRYQVQIITLKLLNTLAEVSPHSVFSIEAVVAILEEKDRYFRGEGAVSLEEQREEDKAKVNQVSIEALRLLQRLAPVQHKNIYSTERAVSTLLQSSLNPSLSDHSISVLTDLAIEGDNIPLSNQVMDYVVILISKPISLCTSLLFQSVSKLIKFNPELLSTFASSAVYIVKSASNLLDIEPLVKCLSLVTPLNKQAIATPETLTILIECLRSMVGGVLTEAERPVLVSLFLVILRAFDEQIEQINGITVQLSSIIEIIYEKHIIYAWTTYCLAQYSMFYGFHGLAKTIFQKVIYMVESDCNYFWMKGLLGIAEIENSIGSSSNMDLLLSEFHTAYLSLKASSLNEQPLRFQQEFLQLRENHLTLLLSIKSLLWSLTDQSNIYKLDAQNKIQSLQSLIQQYKSFQNRYLSVSEQKNIHYIIESFTLSASIIADLINRVILNKEGDSSSALLQIEKLEDQEESQSTTLQPAIQSKIPLYKYCIFINQILNTSNPTPTIDINFFKQTINGLIGLPCTYPLEFFIPK